MRIKHRFSFNNEVETKDVLDFLIKNSIKYDELEELQIIVFEAFEDNEKWDEIKEIMAKYNIESLCEALYSKEEYEKASWFRTRSMWRWEYPQPEEGYEYSTYDASHFCEECGYGLIQKGIFKVKKPPKWGNRNFLMLNWVEDELFINDKVESVLISKIIKEFKIQNVNKINTDEPIKNMKQIFVNDILQPGLVNKNNTIRRESKCLKCGCVKRITTGRGIIFNKEIFSEIEDDIIKSYEVFGDGLMCARMIFVSKRFYNIIKEHGLDKALIFEPIMLI